MCSSISLFWTFASGAQMPDKFNFILSKARPHISVFLLAHLSEGGEAVVHGVAPLLVHQAGVGPGIVTVVSQRQRPGTEPAMIVIMTVMMTIIMTVMILTCNTS